MANCHDQFNEFHEEIELNDSSEANLQRGRDAIRDLIKADFRDKGRAPVPDFCAQGSFPMRTTVNPIDGEYDLDDGVYLQHLDKTSDAEWPTPETVHGWICDAVDGHTDQPPVDKRTCVRVVYAGEYHIDLPIYSELNGKNLHAGKGDRGWHPSDPVEFTKWFQKAVKEHGEQVRRVVRHLKAWADFNSKDGSLASSIILTTLVVQNFRADDREDVCFANTASAIRAATASAFCVFNPVDSSEELTARLDDEEKKRFLAAVAKLANAANSAVGSDTQAKASKLWRKQFGDRFPLVEDETKDDEQKKADAERLASIYVAKSPSKPWIPIE